MMTSACSWLSSDSSNEENIPVGQEDDDTDLSVIPLINLITKYPLETYRQDVSQGNEITPEMLLEIKPGLNKSQVRFVLGTPLIQDSFHKNRWDYIYVIRKEGKFIESRHLVLTFEKDVLVGLTGDLIDRNEDIKVEESKKPFGTVKEWDEEALIEEQKKFENIEDKNEILDKNTSLDNEQKLPANEPVKKNAVEESGSVSQSVKEDLKTSLPDKEDPSYLSFLWKISDFKNGKDKYYRSRFLQEDGSSYHKRNFRKSDLHLVKALDLESSPRMGKDAGELLGIKSEIFSKFRSTLENKEADILIDFTRPEANELLRFA